MRRGVAIGWAVALVVLGVLAAFGVEGRASDLENAADSAPQQTVAEVTAIREGVEGGLALLGLLGAIVVVQLAPSRQVHEETAIIKGTHTRCPRCDELVRVDASLCPHCRSDVGAWSGPPGSEPPS